MTSQTYELNTIMAYVGASADVVGVTGTSGCPDWEGDSLYLFSIGSGSTAGLRKFDIDPDGDETQQKKRSDIGVTSISDNGAAIAYNGEFLYFVASAFNYDQFAKVNTSDLSLNATVGTAAASASEDSSHVLATHQFTVQNSGGSPLLVSSSLSALEHISTTGFGAFVHLGGLTEAADSLHGGPSVGGGILAPGGGHIGNHNVYAFGLPFQNGVNGSNNANEIGVYRIDTGVNRVGGFDVADVDATWTRINTFHGGAYDETDGHLICGVKTDESGPSNTAYIMKVSSTNGSILWKRAVNHLTSYNNGFTHSRIRNSMFHYLGLGSLVYHIDTTDGSVTTETFAGLTTVGDVQISDDVTNSIIIYGTFFESSPVPDYVGTVMDTGGNHHLTAWMRVWFATEAPGDGDGDGGLAGGLALSTQRAWTYTQDAHTFYVFALGAEGTFVYDRTTEQWSEFTTAGFNQWDFLNGVMWGSTRVVGGDIDSTDLWELDPSAKDDNDGAAQISHIVMGMLQTRSRDKIDNSAVYLSASFGRLGNDDGSTMRLRFSDDGGHNYSAYYDVDIEQNDYSGEIEWRSLGGFARPGRIYEFSDSGGPIKIEGADADVPDDSAG